MRKLFLLFLAFTAGVLTLAWINSRPARGSSPRESPPRRGSDDEAPATPSRSAPAAGPRRCAGTTGGGKRCSREAQEGSRFCWQHG